ncbi:hypothetical protein HIM_12395 [Hirsutella minnesotensis 3608]|uniref:Uncharacterized protein n=1 Tax=Hirsutella minnesotensis 3608 TaxID=1043627 RepID=A0A0F8A058_9HYPO|nr:hypothetical protein HIM_12395 [Hirsutella minnesotensis 3608]
MLEKVERLPFRYNLAASALSWLLLAGYLVLPSTFSSIQKSPLLEKTTLIKNSMDHLARDVPLIVFASIFCLTALAGLLCLWWKHHDNYIWVQRRIFLPVVMNSVMGFLSTLLHIYTIQEGYWSVTAQVTAGVTGGWFIISCGLYFYYDLMLLQPLRYKYAK